MNNEEKAYLEVLAFTFLQNAKYDQALLILLALKRLFPKEAKIPLSRAYAYIQIEAYQAGYEEALLASKLATDSPSLRYFSLLLMSKALWLMGQEAQAQQILVDFLKEQKRSHVHPLRPTTTNLRANN